MRMSWSGSLFVGVSLIVLGVLMVIIGPVAFSVINSTIDTTVEDGVIINGKEDDGFVGWQSSGQASDPLNLASFYLFNVTNVNEVRAGAVPIVEEVGPYTYRQISDKIDVEFNDDGSQVSYKWYDHYHFLPDLSSGSEDDLITTINAGYLGVLAQTGSEAGLAVAVFASYMTSTLRSLNDSFLPQAVAGAIPTTISGFRAQVGEGNFDPAWGFGVSAPVQVSPTDTITEWVPTWTTPGIVANRTAQFFNPLVPYSVVHPTQFGVWLLALQDPNAALLLQKVWQIDSATQVAISLWLLNWRTNNNEILLSLNFGEAIEDLPYMQWGSLALTSPASLYFLDDSVTFFVEFAAWSSFVQGQSPPETFNVTLSKELFNGNGLHTGFRNPQEVGTFLTLLGSGNLPEIQARYSLTPPQASSFYMFYQYVISKTLEPALQAGGGLWTTHNARDFIFHYDDPLLALLNPASSVVAVTRNYSSVEDVQANSKVEIRYTGEGDITKLTWYKQWRGRTSIDYWAGEPEVFTGSSATNFPPGVEKDVSWPIFSGTLERNIVLDYVEEVEVLGLKAFSYTIPGSTFESAEKNPDNARYYTFIDGLHNLTLAEIVPGAVGVPLFLSQPHFLGVDPAENAKVRLLKDGTVQTGFTPDADRDASFIMVEPITGAAIDYRRGLQANIHIQPQFFGLFNPNVTEMFLPVFYKDESSTLTEKQANDLKDRLYGAQNLAVGLLVGFLIGGVLLLVVGIVVIAFGVKQRRALSD